MPLDRKEVPPVYPLTSRLPGRALPDLVVEMIEGGARWIQYREKDLHDAARLSELEVLVASLPAFVRLFVNDRADLALAAGADGVHLGEDDLPAEAAREFAGERLLIGVSTHSVESACRAAASPSVDYVAVGPIFPSTTRMVRSPLGPDALRQIRPHVSKPLIAIGGIDETNIGEVLRAGADAAAVVAAVHRNGTVKSNVGRLVEAAELGR
ncbi:MAG TPA: thiamine phosphate synthase [Thermoanaerobaculia bacterium]|nr:thiamine phosphate synthase [Thermoanaerobaculia bacterium]